MFFTDPLLWPYHHIRTDMALIDTVGGASKTHFRGFAAPVATSLQNRRSAFGTSVSVPPCSADRKDVEAQGNISSTPRSSTSELDRLRGSLARRLLSHDNGVLQQGKDEDEPDETFSYT